MSYQSLVVNDDGGQVNSTGVIDLTTSTHTLSTTSSSYGWIAFRFTGLTAPQGATIRSAKLRLRLSGVATSSGGIWSLSAQDADTAPALTTTVNDISSRTLTSSVPAAQIRTDDLPDGWYEFDVSSILQTVVSRAGWTPGNAVLFVMHTPGLTTTLSVDMSETSNDAQLSVTYDGVSNSYLPSASENVAAAWANISNVYADDASSAVGTDVSTNSPFTLKDFGITNLAGHTIDDIEVTIKAIASADASQVLIDVELSWDGGSSWTTAKPTNKLGDVAIETYKVGGGPTAWGHAFTVSELSNANFRVRITPKNLSAAADTTIQFVGLSVFSHVNDGTVTTTRTQTGIARVFATLSRLQTGVSNILGSVVDRTQTGKANITLPLAQTLTDNFNDNSRDTAKWNTEGSNWAEQNNQLELGNVSSSGVYSTYKSVNNYNLTGSYLYSQLVNAGNQSLPTFQAVAVQVYLDASNTLSWIIGGGMLVAQKQVSGSYSDQRNDTAYNSAVHKFFRIRESAGTIYWDYSTDGSSWTNYASLAAPFAVTNINLRIAAGAYGPEVGTTVAYFDTFNTLTSDTTTSRTQTGVSRISSVVGQAQTGKSRITAVALQTQTGKGRITATASQTQVGSSRITASAAQVQTGKSRVTATGTQDQTGKARLTASTPRTQTGVSRVTAATVRLQTGTARIATTISRDQTGAARVQVVATRNQTGAANLVILGSRIQTGVALLTHVIGTDYFNLDFGSLITTRDQTGVSRVAVLFTRTQTGVSKIDHYVAQDISGVSRIQRPVTQDQTGKSRILAIISQNQTGVARLTATSSRNQVGVSRVQIVNLQAQTGTARILAIATRDQTGVARLTGTTTRDQTGVAHVLTTTNTSRAQTGVARIHITVTQDQTGKATVVVVQTYHQTGVARVQAITSRDQLGAARVQASYSRPQTAIARVQAVTLHVQTGRSRIYATVQQSQTGVAYIGGSYYREKPKLLTRYRQPNFFHRVVLPRLRHMGSSDKPRLK
jgi:hypothetical protein